MSPQVMQEIESEHIKVDSKYRSIFLKFIQEVTSKLKHKQDLETSILKLLKSVNHNNIAQVKKYVGGKDYTIPRVAMKTLYGYEDEQGVKLEIESSKQIAYQETDQMNPVELACVRGCKEVLSYFVKDMNLKSKTEFNVNHATLPLEQQPFIYCPLLRKDAGVIEILLDIANMWNYDELSLILVFMKQVKWREGIQIFFKSNAVK